VLHVIGWLVGWLVGWLSCFLDPRNRSPGPVQEEGKPEDLEGEGCYYYYIGLREICFADCMLRIKVP
jgi:hypothetical protein